MGLRPILLVGPKPFMLEILSGTGAKPQARKKEFPVVNSMGLRPILS